MPSSSVMPSAAYSVWFRTFKISLPGLRSLSFMQNGDEAETTEQRLDTVGASDARVPTWVWVVLGALGLALVVVTLGLFLEARDASANAKAASASAALLLDTLVADVKTTNTELKTFNEQFESALTSAEAKAAQAKKKQSERSSSNEPSP